MVSLKFDTHRENCGINNSIEEFLNIESWLLLIVVYTVVLKKVIRRKIDGCFLGFFRQILR